jgi:hypothetical protein
MADMALEAISQLSPLLDTLQPIITTLRWVLGGVFGIYLILIIVRIYYERKKVAILKDIRYDLEQQNIHQGIPFSSQKKRTFKKMIARLRKK